ncbi:hypothetical protein B0H11DRAFT_1867546 [Mycena galericulata]|nr:hypothetical protein B0H11DRAFT_1867546 [Mycena galericulata]
MANRTHGLRSRSTSFGYTTKIDKFEQDTELQKRKSPPGPTRSRGLFTIFRKISDIYKLLLFSLILLAVVFPRQIWHTTAIALQVPATISSLRERPNPIQTDEQQSPAETSSAPRKVPLVDRSILQRLADLEISPDPDERPYFASSNHWPPIVTRIPEPKRPVAMPVDICEGPAPCRFLLPLRIAEQESKARIHFMEIVQLAQKLDRILVLPNVGKSRMGACFKADFEMYYDLKRLTADPQAPAIVTQHLFRRWMDAAEPFAQLVFLSATPDPIPPIFSNDDVSIRVGAPNSSMDLLPGCFAKYHALGLDAHAPLHIHLKSHTRPWPIDASILDALTRPDIHAAAPDPAVLVLTWDLRYPIFPPTPARPRLHYAPRLHALAAALAPSQPYVMVHWRMESVPPEALPQCAHALVDTLAGLPGGGRTLWFASDYPHGVHPTANDSAMAKSGTFRGAGPLHAEAMDILREAFAEGGELEGWEVAELTEARLATWEPEHREDAGVRAIVDKIIGMRAALFVSGASGCARSSSFTRQVLDDRREALGRPDSALENLVEYFG